MLQVCCCVCVALESDRVESIAYFALSKKKNEINVNTCRMHDDGTPVVDTLDEVLRQLSARKLRVVFEDRHPRYCFGVKNYGEARGTRNPADGDPFDVFAPGYARRLPFGKPYVCKEVLGVFELTNGNHKIAVRLFVPGADEKRIGDEISAYCKRYTRFTRKEGSWFPLSKYADDVVAQPVGVEVPRDS